MKYDTPPKINKTPHAYKDVLNEATQFFEKYSRKYPLALSTYAQITREINTALQQNDYDLLLSQLSYMETGTGHLAYQYIGEARHVFYILNIVALENKYHTSSFVNCISNTQELLEKYRLSIFSLRRILFSISPESIADAEYFLRQNCLSPFAIYIIAQKELIRADSSLFERVKDIYSLQWNEIEMQLFQQFIATLTEA